MKVVVLAGILGLSLAGGFLPFQGNQFLVVPDVGDLITDGTNTIQDIAQGNAAGAITSGIDVLGDAVGQHAAAVDGTQAVENAVNGNWLAAGEDAVKTVGDVTNFGHDISDSINTINDIANGASPTKLLEDGATLLGDATGERDLAEAGISTVNDIANGANGQNLAEDGISIAGALTGNSDLAHDINAGINSASTLLGNSEEQFLFVAPIEIPVVIVGEEDIEVDEFVKIPVEFLNEMF